MQTLLISYEPQQLTANQRINDLIQKLNADPRNDPSRGLFAEDLGNGIVRISDDSDYIDMLEVSAMNILRCSLAIDWELLYISNDIESEPLSPDAIFYTLWEKFECANRKMENFDTGLLEIQQYILEETSYHLTA